MNPEHDRQELVTEAELVGPYSVPRFQQPPRTPMFELVQRVGRSPDLAPL
jgi:hypothetical protein